MPCYLSGFCVAHGRSGLGPGPYNCPGTWLPLNWPTLSGINFWLWVPAPTISRVAWLPLNWPTCLGLIVLAPGSVELLSAL